VPRITNFCSCIYVFECRLSLVRFCDSDFGITTVDDITIGISCAAFCFNIAHISFASSWNLFLAGLCVFETTMSIKNYYYYLLLGYFHFISWIRRKMRKNRFMRPALNIWVLSDVYFNEIILVPLQSNDQRKVHIVPHKKMMIATALYHQWATGWNIWNKTTNLT